jgi:chromosome segregation ATPase
MFKQNHGVDMTIEEELEAVKATNKELVDKVGFLEKDLSKAIAKRDEAKQALADNTGDEELRKELDNYKEQLSQVEQDKADIESTFTHKLAQRDMISQLNELGVKAHNMDALNAIAELTLSDAKYEDGSFKYLKDDGTTKFSDTDKEYSIQDKINELKEGDKSYLFKQATGGGASDTTTAPPPSNDINSILDANLKY